MPITKAKRSIRGLQNIRTISGQMDVLATPYKAYMKVSILEMELFRQGKERASALEKLESIDKRFAEIEEEKQKTLAQLEELKAKQAGQGTAGAKGHTSSGNPDSFKIKY